jgi:CO/xanthine dehydrogenase Mo-binding subunit
MRGLGGTQNTFANESFVDELAFAAQTDPVAFRLRHLSDARAIAVLRTVAAIADWTPRVFPHPPRTGTQVRGRGVAFVRYENTQALVATVADVVLDRASGTVRCERIFVAHDCGLIVNPDGLRNQIEGNAIQALSRTLKEAVTFDRNGVTSLDWRGYPILRFSEVPDVRIALIDRPDQPVLGAGEATTTTIAPAVANAIFDAAGVRLRNIPFTPARVAAAVRTASA